MSVLTPECRIEQIEKRIDLLFKELYKLKQVVCAGHDEKLCRFDRNINNEVVTRSADRHFPKGKRQRSV